ncbi:MAG: glutathione S-transferase family protein [Halioglobus sp.]|nr:glutathione S-transferase family protein [Halioglobus sp.]
MKVYTYDPAPNPQRLAIFLKLKGVEIATQQVDIAAAEQLGAAYREINPAATVPTLVLDDGTALSEVIGMYTYLEALYPEPPLMGQTPLERAEAVSWCHKLSNGLTLGIASVFRNRSKGFRDRALPGPLNLPQIPALVERGQRQIDAILPQLDAHLADLPWLAGDNFTVADIDLYVAIGFLSWIKRSVPETYTELIAWQERANERMG